ncbi:MAG: hypothetical protein COZ68_11365, partial [Deltaproteobacteria bacterium CG_4_8_14_3_um_filter_43_13]
MKKWLTGLMVVGITVLLFGVMAVVVSTAEAGKPTIKHYGIVDLTGPYGILVPDLWEAMLDYYRLVNEQG